MVKQVTTFPKLALGPGPLAVVEEGLKALEYPNVSSDDHRSFNRNGEAFDKGETFSGVPYEVALDVVDEIRRFITGDITMAKFALRWILMNENVTVVIPGSKNKAQSEANAQASNLSALSDETMSALKHIYQEKIAPWVHQRW